MVHQVISYSIQTDSISNTILTASLLLLGVNSLRHQIWRVWLICTAFTLIKNFSSINETRLRIFIGLFLFRYVRLIVNLIAFCCYKPIAVSRDPGLTAKDVTVIIPTVEPYGQHFVECIRSIYANGPANIIVVTAGPGNYETAIKTLSAYSNILIKHCLSQNKRRQICEALPEVRKRKRLAVATED